MKTAILCLAFTSYGLAAGCAASLAAGAEPYLHKVAGPNVWVRVPKYGLTLQEAIDISQPWAREHCSSRGDDVVTYFVAADTATMKLSEYEVTWRCCRPDDECCIEPKACE